MQPGLVRLLLPLLAVCLGLALAQDGGGENFADKVEFELGIRGAVVENSWNPLRLVLRDLPPVEFELRIDQGTLRSGSIPLIYSANIDSSRGLTVFEDEVFIPPWSSLSWTLGTPQRTFASGTLDPRLRDNRALTLLLSDEPGRWLGSLPEGSRPQEVVAGELPRRAAAYSGVEALLIDGTTSPPTVESVVAAAAAGVVVVLVEPPPASHRPLSQLSPSGSGTRIGAGWLITTGSSAVSEAFASHRGFAMQGAASALLAGQEAPAGPPYSRITMVSAGAIYALLVLLLLRFGGQAGIPAALVVAVLTALAGWLLLRPEQAIVEQQRTLIVSTGGLGLSLPTLAIRSLPGGEVRVPRPMRLSDQVPYNVGSNGTRLSLGRWQRQLLLGKPALASSVLVWLDGQLENRGERLLQDVLVLGWGPQPPLQPGAVYDVVASEEALLPQAYGDLLELLPPGTAVANDGERYLVALPPDQEGSL